MGVTGLSILSVWGGMLCLAGIHRAFAWLATFCTLGWLYYFVKLHMLRFSQAGRVCFGDIGEYADESEVYLLQEGTFLKYMIVS